MSFLSPWLNGFVLTWYNTCCCHVIAFCLFLHRQTPQRVGLWSHGEFGYGKEIRGKWGSWRSEKPWRLVRLRSFSCFFLNDTMLCILAYSSLESVWLIDYDFCKEYCLDNPQRLLEIFVSLSSIENINFFLSKFFCRFLLIKD